MPDIVTAMVEFPANGGTCQGYLARPDDGQPHPGIVVIQEWWGLEPHIKDVTERFAREGFVALAPDLYHGRVTQEPSEAQKLAREMDRERAVKEIIGAVRYLKGQPFCTGKVGTIGYCMGGGLSILAACRSPEVDAAASYYGGLPNPIDQLQNLSGPLLAVHAGRDYGDPRARAQQLREAMQRFGKTLEEHWYEDAQHAFFNDSHRESYHPEAARDVWPKTVDFFRRHLGAPVGVVP
jgi:carboxymethylenebutenolidase